MDSSGKVVGASKIARDISDRRRAEEQKDLLLGEMDHRVKNLFALAGGLVNLSARGAASVPDLVSDIQGKFVALSRAHSLTLSAAETNSHQITTLHTLIAEVTEPYRMRGRRTPDCRIRLGYSAWAQRGYEHCLAPSRVRDKRAQIWSSGRSLRPSADRML